MGLRRGIACCVFVSIIALGADQTKHGKEPDGGGDEPVYELTSDITPPRVVRQVNPDYSPGSRGVRLQGSVDVELVVSSHGDAKNARVVKSLDKDVDADVVRAVRQWRFDPARKDRKPVAVRVVIEIEFHPM